MERAPARRPRRRAAAASPVFRYHEFGEACCASHAYEDGRPDFRDVQHLEVSAPRPPWNKWLKTRVSGNANVPSTPYR